MLTLAWKGLRLAIGLALLAAVLAGAGLAEAHGKEVNIAVTCVAPDPGRPLTKVCTALLKYLDGEPVVKADFQLTAAREGKAEAPVGPVKFTPLEQEGVYSVMVVFPTYGSWRLKFRVSEPGEGESEIVEEILPPLPGASPEIKAQLQVVFSFGLSDVRNITLRVVHLLAAIAWFTLPALVLVLSYIVPVEQRYRFLGRLATVFPWAAGASLLIVALSGIYSARYNAPTRSPGLFDPAVFAKLPFGEGYLMAFFVKMALVAAILAATGALAVALRKVYKLRVPVVAGAARGVPFALEQSHRSVALLAVVNLLLGLLVFADVVVLEYLHMISHVAAAAGGR